MKFLQIHTNMGAIVVTGACRTGTSLMMQTLRILGVPVVGLEYHKEFPDDGFHPHGAWDLPYADTINGIHGDIYDGKAIKLFGLQLSRSEPNSIDCAIVCRRHRVDAIASAERMCLARGDQMLDFGDAYDKNYVCIGAFTEMCNIPTFSVQFEIMVTKPSIQIERLIRLLDLHPNDSQTNSAIANVVRCKGE